jgi:hypothetical protein
MRGDGGVLVGASAAMYDAAPGTIGSPTAVQRQEDNVVDWLAPVALFWTVAALYLGGFPIRIEGGNGPRQLIGLVATLALYMGTFALLRMVLTGLAGHVGGIALACLVTTLLLPVLARIGFVVVGVRIRALNDGHG